MLTIVFVVSTLSVLSNGNIKISRLSNTHCMAMLSGNGKYLLLPVEEKADIAHISLLSNNEVVKSLNVRLAVNGIDYYVPFDLSKFKGAQVLLDIHFQGDLKKDCDEKEYVCWNSIVYSDSFDTSNKEMFRPLIHHTPKYGWMNDPNGMVYKDGIYHLYFQHNPYGSQWENMTWGHSESSDLVHWRQMPNAIMPDALGTIFSGSCVVDKDNTAGFGKGAILAIYTSAGESQTQSIAYSTDNGLTFTKYANNPVITSDVPDFRDPHAFWNESTKKWNIVMAAGQEMRFYSSPDFKVWTYESSFGLGYGAHGGVWECPDLFELPVKGTNVKKWVLVCNINPGGPFGGNATQYFIGSFDGHKFTCESKPEVTKWMDYGKDHYAAVTFSNAPEGRNIIMAWMSNWQYGQNVPTMQYRSANSVPRDLGLYEKDGETYLSVNPSKEVDGLRGKAVLKTSFLSGKKSISKAFNTQHAYEMIIEMQPSNCGQVCFTLSNDKGERVDMSYDMTKHIFSMDRTKSGAASFSKDFPAVTIAPMESKSSVKLRLIVDKCSIEAFDGDGHFSMTNLVFPSIPYDNIACCSSGKCKVSLSVYPLNK